MYLREAVAQVFVAKQEGAIVAAVGDLEEVACPEHPVLCRIFHVAVVAASVDPALPPDRSRDVPRVADEQEDPDPGKELPYEVELPAAVRHGLPPPRPVPLRQLGVDAPYGSTHLLQKGLEGRGEVGRVPALDRRGVVHDLAIVALVAPGAGPSLRCTPQALDEDARFAPDEGVGDGGHVALQERAAAAVRGRREEQTRSRDAQGRTGACQQPRKERPQRQGGVQDDSQ